MYRDHNSDVISLQKIYLPYPFTNHKKSKSQLNIILNIIRAQYAGEPLTVLS